MNSGKDEASKLLLETGVCHCKSFIVVRTQAADSASAGGNSQEFDDPPEYDLLSVSAELEPDTHPLEYDIPTSMSPESAVAPTCPELELDEEKLSEHHQGPMMGKSS